MLLYTNLPQILINSVKINLSLIKQEKNQNKVFFINKVNFFKVLLKKKIYFKHNSFLKYPQFIGNHNSIFNFSIKKSLNDVIVNVIPPMSNTFFLVKTKFQGLCVYCASILKRNPPLFKARKSYRKKAVQIFKRKIFFSLSKTLLKLKTFLLRMQNLDNFFNFKNFTKIKIFLLLKQKLPNTLKNNQFIFSFIKNCANFYKLTLLIQLLKKKKKPIFSFSEINLFYNKFIGFFTKKGEKQKSLKIINKALLIVSKKAEIPVNVILRKLRHKLSTSVEIKKIKIRRSFHLVPFPVNLKRKFYLIIKWFIFALSIIEEKKNLEYKLSEEILKILKNEESIVIYSKKYQIQKSFKYQANTHFRW